jgi:hypothetical protein
MRQKNTFEGVRETICIPVGFVSRIQDEIRAEANIMLHETRARSGGGLQHNDTWSQQVCSV